MRNLDLRTQLIHAGQHHPRIGGAAVTPIFQTATFDFRGDDPDETLRYLRYNNTPNHEELHRKLAILEEADAALVTASGMAAIASTLLAHLSRGDHLVVQDSLYGGTATLVDVELPRMGISVDRFDARRPETLAAVLRPATRAVLTEALSNPLVRVPDHDGILALAREHRLLTLIDATFVTPVNFKPVAAGYDLALHSCTKYLNGHSDLVAGAVVGRHDLVERVATCARSLGGTLDAHACFLLDRGLKTLSLRVGYQNESAQRIATWLEHRTEVTTVHYPGLPSHPDHQRGKQYYTGFGGVLAFDLANGAVAAALLRNLRLAIAAPSLGGVETLVSRPMLTSHAGLAPSERLRLGIVDGQVRLAVGIEATDDLIADLEQALDHM